MGTVDIFDLLPPEAHRSIDDIDYAFLKEHGYDTSGANKFRAKAGKLKKALKRRGEDLCYQYKINHTEGTILFWFELVRGEKLVARSQAVKFVQIKKGGAHGTN